MVEMIYNTLLLNLIRMIITNTFISQRVVYVTSYDIKVQPYTLSMLVLSGDCSHYGHMKLKYLTSFILKRMFHIKLPKNYTVNLCLTCVVIKGLS